MKPIDDPTMDVFWAAAKEHRLLVQRCEECGAHQFYARSFCLRCDGIQVDWVETCGKGTVYSITTVHFEVRRELPPPYDVAIVELDEGPRVLMVAHGSPRIGDRVKIGWRERDDLPPVPMAIAANGDAEHAR